MKIVLAFLFILISLSIASATTITISSSTIPNYQVTGDIAYIRVFASQGFYTSDNIFIAGGTPTSSTGFFKSVQCTVNQSTKEVSCPSFTLPSTTDARTGADAVRYTAVLFSKAGVKVATILSDFVLQANRNPVTWADIAEYNGASQPYRDTNVYTRMETDNRIAAAVAGITPSTGGGGSGGAQVYSVTDYGAVANNGLDDKAGVQAAVTAAQATGGIVQFPCGTFNWDSVVTAYGKVSFRGTPGCTVIKKTASTGYGPSLSVESQLSAYRMYEAGQGAISAGTSTLTLSSVSGLAVGDIVVQQLGDDPTDCCRNGYQYQQFTTITAIAGSYVTFATPTMEAVSSVSGITDGVDSQPKKHQIRKVLKYAQGVSISDLTFDNTNATLATNNAVINFAVNAHIHDLYSPLVYGKLALGINIQNGVMERVYAEKSSVGSDATLGGITGGWAVKNQRVSEITCNDCPSIGIAYELQNRNLVIEKVDLKSKTQSNFVPMIDVGQGGKGVIIRDSIFYTAVTRASVISGIYDYTENITLVGPYGMTALIKHRGYISYNGVTYNEKRTITKTVLLDSSTANPFIFVDGLLVNVKMYLPTLTGLTAISDARQPSGGGTSSNGSLLSQLTAGSVVDLGGFNGLAQVYDGDADGIPEHRVGFFWTTNGSWSPNSYITIQAEYYPFPADAESRALIAENANLVNLNRLQFTGRTFANLGTPANGTFYYCTDCTEADPCAGSGTGAFARRLNNRWKCN